MSQITEAEFEIHAAEIEHVLEQLIRSAVEHRCLVDSMVLMVSLVGTGEDGVTASLQVASAMGLPQPQRLH